MEKILVILLIVALMVIILLLIKDERKRRRFAGTFAIIWLVPCMGHVPHTLTDFIALGAMCLFAVWWFELDFRN